MSSKFPPPTPTLSRKPRLDSYTQPHLSPSLDMSREVPMSWRKSRGFLLWEISPQTDASSPTSSQPSLGPTLAFPANYHMPWQFLLAAQTPTPWPARPLLLSVLPGHATSAVHFQNHCIPLGFTVSLLRSRHSTRHGGTQENETQPHSVGRTDTADPSDLRMVRHLTGI